MMHGTDYGLQLHSIVDKGTEVIIRIPMIHGGRSRMQKIRTLIVDDEARIRRGIERLVHSCGDDWEVVATASDGRKLSIAFIGCKGPSIY